MVWMISCGSVDSIFWGGEGRQGRAGEEGVQAVKYVRTIKFAPFLFFSFLPFLLYIFFFFFFSLFRFVRVPELLILFFSLLVGLWSSRFEFIGFGFECFDLPSRCVLCVVRFISQHPPRCLKLPT